MAFSANSKHAAYRWAGGHCKWLRQSCAAHYAGRCGRPLTDGRHAHHVQAVRDGETVDLDNCEGSASLVTRRPRGCGRREGRPQSQHGSPPLRPPT